MISQVGQAGFRIAFFMIFVAGVLLLLLPPGTAEFYITVLTLLMGLAFAGVIVLLVRFFD
jgi:hypothetical protein